MGRVIVLSTVGLLWLGVGACGASNDAAPSARAPGNGSLAGGKHIEGSVTTHGAYYVGDHDDDDFKHSEPDNDDPQVRDYGKAASGADLKAVAGLVARYYTAVGADDGARACSLLSAQLKRSANLAETVTDAYVAPADPAALRGMSCGEIATAVFKENGAELAAEIPTLQVTAVRLEGEHGLALLGFKTTPERFIEVLREGGQWKMDALLDTEMP